MHSNTLTHIRTESDLDAALAALTSADARFAALIATAGRPPLRRRPDGFAGLAATVVSQQLSTASAGAIWARLAAAFDPFEPQAIMRARASKLARLGLSAPKIRALKAIARAVASERLALTSLVTIEAEAAHAHSPQCTGSARGPPTFICCPASAMPTLGRPAIWRCKKRRGSPSRCRSGRAPRRWSHSPKCGGRCARWRRACCGPTIAPSKAATEHQFHQKLQPIQAALNHAALNQTALNGGGMAGDLIAPRTRSSHKFAEPSHANFGFKSGVTRKNSLASLSIPKFVRGRRKWCELRNRDTRWPAAGAPFRHRTAAHRVPARLWRRRQ